MNYVLMAVSMSACLLGGILKKYLSDRFVNSAFLCYVFNSVISLTAAVVLTMFGGIHKTSLFTVLLGALFGFITAMQQFFTLKAYATGLFSYTSLITSLSTIIPTFSGFLLWNEDITAIQGIGIFLMIICFVCSVSFDEKQEKTSKLWFLYAVLAFLFAGAIGVMQKWHQNTVYKAERDSFLIIAFAISFVYSLVCMILTKPRQKNGMVELERCNIKWSAIILMIICGICVAVNNKLNLYLSGVLDSTVFYPVDNVGRLVVTILLSIVLFKEKLNLKKWVGVLVGIVAVILLCDPFK